VDVLPADAEVTIDHAGLSACDAMPNGADSAELLDVDVDKLARVVTFIAPDRFGRLRGEQVLRGEGIGIMTLVHMVRAGLVVTNAHTDKSGRTQQRCAITDLGLQLIEE
jgi:hypothetical protein